MVLFFAYLPANGTIKKGVAIMKKIAIINDVHSNYLLLKSVLDDIKKYNVDDFIFCGDYITDGFDNDKVLDIIKSKTKNIIAGNRDLSIANYDNKSWDDINQMKSMLYAYTNTTDENKAFLKTLPIFKIINIENKKICFSHGTPFNVRKLVNNNSYDVFDKLIDNFSCDIYLFAHTHIPFHIIYRNKHFINSGAISCSVDNNPHSTYGILSIQENDIQYSQKELYYNFEDVKKYYIESNYHRECKEWSNLILYTLRDGFDYCCDFIQFINKFSNGSEKIISDLWHIKFEEYMHYKNLEIF